MTPSPSIAIIGAAGSCGRQLAAQILERRLLPREGRLQLVGHHGGRSEFELHGLRADLRDAYADHAPAIELVDTPEAVDTEIVVMLAGATISTDPHGNADRLALARTNLEVFRSHAEAQGRRSGPPPLVIVQSNPVELAVEVFSRSLDRHRVVGVGSYSDSLRFRREIADAFGTARTEVQAMMLGQHGDMLVPAWSGVEVSGVDPQTLNAWIDGQRADRAIGALPEEIRSERASALALIAEDRIHEAFARAATLPPDLRCAVKPFLVHFTAGHTTEIVTAHAVADVVASVLDREQRVLPLQVRLEGELHDLHGVGAVPVVLGAQGWSTVVDPGLMADELDHLRAAFTTVAQANAEVLGDA